MRELPRKLTTDELAELFEGRTRLVELLAEIENPLNRAEEIVKGLTEEEKLEALDAHPAIGERQVSLHVRPGSRVANGSAQCSTSSRG